MKHIPFRGSKLTQVLKESFVGKKNRTVMVACCAPNTNNVEHTLNTLRYADRVKERDAATGLVATVVANNGSNGRHKRASISAPGVRPSTAPVSNSSSNDDGSFAPDNDLARDEEGQSDDSLILERLLSDDLDDSSEKVDFEEKRLSSRQSRTNGVPGGDGPRSTSASGVFVQGAAKDKSWRAQVSRLRESTTRNHNLHLRSVGLNPEDDIGNVDDDGFDDDMRIRVVVRKRPMAEGEASNKEDFDAIHTLTHKDYSKVLVYQPKTRVDLTKEVETIPFAFDNAFDDRSSNVDIYERTVRNLVPSAFEGNHCNVFAYGQTGSGKTFTMMGSAMTGANAGNQDESSPGLYYLAAQDVFCLAEDEEFRNFTITASLFEIYGGKLFDLLNQRSPIKCLEDHRGKVCFPGLTEHAVTDARELMSLIESGGRQRSTGTTSANADSSRSHAVLQLSLKKGRESRPIEHGEQSWGYAFVLPVMVFPRVAFICIIMSIVRSAYFLTFDFRSIFFCFMLLTTSTRAAHLH